MGLPGPIEQGEGVVGSSAILPGWIGMTAETEMRRRLDIPVMVDNDANLGALAEAAFGAGRDAGDLVYLKVSSGIGAGLILNGRLYRGSGGLAGELGHVLVDPDGIVCRCGNRGCLETVAATGALVDRLGHRTARTSRCDEMLDAARAGDAGCRRVIQDAGRALGQVVATLLNVLNPELFVIGGELGAAGDLLLDGVRESVARAALPEASRGAAGGGRRAGRPRAGARGARAGGLRGRPGARRRLKYRPGRHGPLGHHLHREDRASASSRRRGSRRTPSSSPSARATRPRAAAYAEQHGIPRVHGSYEALLADPEVDAVYNPLPNSLHVPWSITRAGGRQARAVREAAVALARAGDARPTTRPTAPAGC